MFHDLAGRWRLPRLPRTMLRRLLRTAAAGADPRRAARHVSRLGSAAERPATIRWNDHLVPFVEARTDRDLAFCLGMVHAHLREGQMEFLKLLAHGRLAEFLGPLAFNLDHAIRIVDFAFAADAIERGMPEETRTWTQAYVDGLNHYWARVPRRTPEFRLLGRGHEPWTIRDVCTVGRLVGADFYWLAYLPLLKERGAWLRGAVAPGARSRRVRRRTIRGRRRPGGGQRRLRRREPGRQQRGGSGTAPQRHGRRASGQRSAPGRVAAQPLAAGRAALALGRGGRDDTARCPDNGLGQDPGPGLGRHQPAGGVHRSGRGLAPPAGGVPDFCTVAIRSRFWPRRQARVRRCAFGPIISDSKLFPSRPGETIAFRWVGHEPTDEITAFLRAVRARTPEALWRAFAGYGITPLNVVFADRRGNIGHFLAVTQPVRAGFPEADLVLAGSDPKSRWNGSVDTMGLPFTLNPPEGVVASANDRPRGTETPIGFLFGAESRLRRLLELLDRRKRLTVADLQALQADTGAPDAAVLAVARRATGRRRGGRRSGAPAASLGRRLRRGFVRRRGVRAAAPPPRAACDGRGPPCRSSRPDRPMEPDLVVPAARPRGAPGRAQARGPARRGSRGHGRLARFPTWGDMHRLRIAHFCRTCP